MLQPQILEFFFAKILQLTIHIMHVVLHVHKLVKSFLEFRQACEFSKRVLSFYHSFSVNRP